MSNATAVNHPAPVDCLNQSNRFEIGHLKSAGIRVLEQVLLWAPKSYDDFTNVSHRIEATSSDERRALIVEMDSPVSVESYTPPRVSFFVTDGTTRAKASAFSNTHAWKKLQLGQKILIECIVERHAGKLYIKSPEMFPLEHAGKVIPRYAAVKGVVAEETFYEKTRQALEHCLPATCQYILNHFPGLQDESQLIARANLRMPLKDLLIRLHSPKSIKGAIAGRKAAIRLAAYEITYKAQAQRIKFPEPQSAIDIDPQYLAHLLTQVPFKPTADQSRCLTEIIEDLRAPYVGKRLVSGDVGVGKSLPLLVSLAAANHAGAKCAYLVPNDLLAQQLHRESYQWFGQAVPTLLVSGGNKIKKEALKSNPILIGTTALIHQLGKNDYKADFLVVDEQQKMSRGQREALLDSHTNFVEATATSIPRTMALITHGAMDVSIIRERPVQREIKSHVVEQRHKKHLFRRINELLNAGEQVAIIYPLVEGEDEDIRRNVEAAFAHWEKSFPGQCSLIHGKQSQEANRQAIKDMVNGDKRLLVGSTALEVGVTIPKLRAILIVEADRYGAATLHQLRGRIARTGGIGYFFMLPSEGASSDSTARLHMVASTDDGFKLAELDLQTRGFGDLSSASSSQHGISGIMFLSGDMTKEVARLVYQPAL